ncbi:MAG: TRAP transporter small permease [Desulfobacula sp.]|uniref:TRAP transporter small permease n=1 Tax=Desulfobacula sp. TaxID=2593537 RepID=UPI001D61CFBC|nr:TRAP transporter small permease [Desulfobacula sp.]MBT3483681.1 TRAP transporter small permease [Desulfobacula sp.]MBT3803545.1 TRAP transporter small permease [Desulfobacula sp.]MBT4023336.1 TRAP transporter small permease [Desulfobacula sp.]MBT4197321.1 TRAP transporter small permease [Desulfobacula sp.]
MDEVEETRLNPILKMLDFIDTLISRFEGVMLAVGVIAMTVNTIAAVISRFVFNSAITFTDELNMIFIVVVTYAGLSYAARNGRHIRMSAIYDAMPAKTRKALMIVMASVTSAFMFFLSFYSYYYIFEVYKSGRILPALGLPVFYIYLWVPIGFVVTGLQYAFTVVKNLTEKDVYLSTNVKDGYSDTDTDIEV